MNFGNKKGATLLEIVIGITIMSVVFIPVIAFIGNGTAKLVEISTKTEELETINFLTSNFSLIKRVNGLENINYTDNINGVGQIITREEIGGGTIYFGIYGQDEIEIIREGDYTNSNVFLFFESAGDIQQIGFVSKGSDFISGKILPYGFENKTTQILLEITTKKGNYSIGL